MQGCKWVAIDADYDRAHRDLAKLQQELRGEDEVEAALEMSRRGGHLWILCEKPLPARTCRIYIYNLALRLGVPIKGAFGQTDGIEIFPRQDELKPGQLGNAIRGPFGVHRATMSRYWFYDGPPGLERQFDYLRGVRRLTGRSTPPLYDWPQYAGTLPGRSASRHNLQLLPASRQF